METQFLTVAKSLSPDIAYPNFNQFIENLNQQEMEWYTTFRNHVTAKIEHYDLEDLIDEKIRTILPLTTLAAMEIIKDGFGWDDEALIRECKNDVRVRFALGISELSGIPSAAAMQKFRDMVSDFAKHTGVDLMAELVSKITEDKGPVVKLGTRRIMLWAMRVA